jgi:hypothetical protein
MLNAQGSRVIIIVVQVGPVKLICSSRAVQCRRSGKRKQTQDETQFTTKIAGKKKLVWVPIISLFVKKISFPVMRLMPYYATTGHSSCPPPKTQAPPALDNV